MHDLVTAGLSFDVIGFLSTLQHYLERWRMIQELLVLVNQPQSQNSQKARSTETNCENFEHPNACFYFGSNCTNWSFLEVSEFSVRKFNHPLYGHLRDVMEFGHNVSFGQPWKKHLYLLLAMEWMTEWWPNETRNLRNVKRKLKLYLYIGLDPSNRKIGPINRCIDPQICSLPS